jgi:hypothetical protein
MNCHNTVQQTIRAFHEDGVQFYSSTNLYYELIHVNMCKFGFLNDFICMNLYVLTRVCEIV